MRACVWLNGCACSLVRLCALFGIVFLAQSGMSQCAIHLNKPTPKKNRKERAGGGGGGARSF